MIDENELNRELNQRGWMVVPAGEYRASDHVVPKALPIYIFAGYDRVVYLAISRMWGVVKDRPLPTLPEYFAVRPIPASWLTARDHLLSIGCEVGLAGEPPLQGMRGWHLLDESDLNRLLEFTGGPKEGWHRQTERPAACDAACSIYWRPSPAVDRAIEFFAERGYRQVESYEQSMPGDIAVPVPMPMEVYIDIGDSPLPPSIRTIRMRPNLASQPTSAPAQTQTSTPKRPAIEAGPSAVASVRGIEQPTMTMLFDLQTED